MKTKITVFFIMCFLSGCTKIIKPDVAQIKKLPSAEAMAQCTEIKKIADGNFETIVLKLDEVITEYQICTSKHKEISEFIKNN